MAQLVAVAPAVEEAPGSSGAAAAAAAAAVLRGSPSAAAKRRQGPGAWLRRVLRPNMAVAEEQPGEEEAGAAADDASDDGGQDLAECASFGSLPEHLLEKIFLHLRGANRKHHFAM